MLPRVLRSYQKEKEGFEIVNRWHAANKKSDEKTKKAMKDKSQEKPPTSSGSRKSGFSMPRTDTEFNRVLAVDGLPDLEDAPLKFAYGKDLLPSWILCDFPTYMKRMHNWYKRACRLGLRILGAPHHKDVFGLKGPQINDIMFDFEDIQEMFYSKCLIDFVLHSIVLYKHKYLTSYINFTGCKQWMLLFVISRSST